jgi:hypothetical protein
MTGQRLINKTEIAVATHMRFESVIMRLGHPLPGQLEMLLKGESPVSFLQQLDPIVGEETPYALVADPGAVHFVLWRAICLKRGLSWACRGHHVRVLIVSEDVFEHGPTVAGLNVEDKLPVESMLPHVVKGLIQLVSIEELLLHLQEAGCAMVDEEEEHIGVSVTFQHPVALGDSLNVSS